MARRGLLFLTSSSESIIRCNTWISWLTSFKFRTLRTLQDRVKELEQSQQASSAGVRSPSSRISHEAASVAATTTSSREGDELPMESEQRTGVSALVAAITGEPQYEGFQGPSSAATFMSSIRQAVDGNAQSPDALFVVGPAPGHAAKPNTLSTNNRGVPGDYVLPPRRVADSLLACYWTFIHPLYPVLSRTIFAQFYEALWTGRSLSLPVPPLMSMDEATMVCTLNLVLALSCQYSDEIAVGKGFATAEVFFTRARGLFHFDPVDSTDYGLPHLQIMLLIAQYLQGTGRAYKAWNIIAVAIRNCHRLGFHLATTSSKERIPDVVVRELVKRIYHSCVMSER